MRISKAAKTTIKRLTKRETRIKRIAFKLAERADKRRDLSDKKKRPMRRKVTHSRMKRMIAYDLETTSIKAGTPQPLYITAYGEHMRVSQEITNYEQFLNILVNQFLTVENKNCRFVAWNGNNYDIYFIAMALLRSDDYIMRPYLTRSKALRGIKVITKNDKSLSWEFLDGISMTGLVGRKLEFFLKTYAPDYQKLEAPNWETTTFNPKNKKHVEYAERDSEGLYYGMKAAQAITLEHVGIPLQPTIGNLGIKAFMRFMPDTLQIWQAPYTLRKAIKNYVMRGGYCHCVQRYHGPVWKYDLNQAYAAAMRETDLPAGTVSHTFKGARVDSPGVAHITARKAGNKIPFYFRNAEGYAQFATDEITDTWITHTELAQLQAEKWQIEIIESYYWSDRFRMTDYVNKLEDTRINAPEGPNGATGLMIKAIGNNSYGKTVETLDGLELIMCKEKPDGWSEYQAEMDDSSFIWFRINEPQVKDYHQPQIGAMITAYVRMVVRRAALINPDKWLYADTDCVIFSEPVDLNPHPKLYGRWKQETAGEIYRIIEKKVYASADASTKHAKGMNVGKLQAADFERWYNGEAPQQNQIHRNNFVNFMSGESMFHTQARSGTRVPVPEPKPAPPA